MKINTDQLTKLLKEKIEFKRLSNAFQIEIPKNNIKMILALY